MIICIILLCLELYALLYDLSSPTLHGRTQRGESIATIQSEKNNVQTKSFGTLIWGTSEEGQKLYQQDAIATLSDSEAVVSFTDQSEIVVEPESLIIIEQAPKSATPEGERPGTEHKIVARLIKGSIKRRKSSSTPLFIQFSQNAAPVRFDDTKGDSIFRVTHRGYGVEVIVESGTVKIDLQQDVAPHQSVKIDSEGNKSDVKDVIPKLPAPKLKKPKIEIKKSTPKSVLKSAWGWFPSFISEAMAADTASVSVHFEWDPIDGAESYLVQISSTTDFKTIVFEEKPLQPSYFFQPKVPETLTTYYFRVAGINSSGDVGEFSSIEKVEIRPVEHVLEQVAEQLPPPPPKQIVEHPPPPPPQPKIQLAAPPPPPAPPPPRPTHEQPKPSRKIASVRSSTISSVTQFGVFANTAIQSGGQSISPGIVWWPSFIRGTFDLGIGIDVSYLKKTGGAGNFVASNLVGHLGVMGRNWGIDGFAGLSMWFGYGNMALEYGLRVKRTVSIGFIDGLFLGFTMISAKVPTEEVQLGVVVNL